ncbi:hypothetical protein [Haladaptatus salinisoli]|uniref:hypothetical protein n=1 Tax=Haladaptatus salinisoli TaxID=2884876 RepID=UPI001D09A8F0|nr:hypothetical protein [Haladaptatus salinisoli]
MTEMDTGNEPTRSGIGDSVRNYIDNHRLLTYFVVIEALLVFSAWYLDTWVSFVLTKSGDDISDIAAGLLGAWAVIFALIGLVGACLIVSSRLWLRVGRSIGRGSA